MILIEDALSRVKMFAKMMLGEERTQDLRLEEIEKSKHDGRDLWLITLSMQRLPEKHTIVGGPLSMLGRGREFKTFAVDGESGEVLSMKIRELVGVE